MIRYLRILRAALALGQAHYDLEALLRELHRLGVEHTDPPCRSCELRVPLEARLEAARAAYVALRSWHD